MDINNQDDRNQRLSVECERIILYVDDFAAATGQDLSTGFYNRAKDVYTLSGEPDGTRRGHRSCLYPVPPTLDGLGLQLDDRSGLYLLDSGDRSPSPNLLCSQTSTPRRSRCSLDIDQRSSRRSSMSSRSRANSCSRPTPLGDDRRASVSKKTRPRRASTAVPRRDSVRPIKVEVKQTQKIIEDAQQLEQARRHRRIAMIVLGTFIFILAASVLVVVITLTQSSFLNPAPGSKDLMAEHNLRKENEELLNSLNRDISVPENVTAPP